MPSERSMSYKSEDRRKRTQINDGAEWRETSADDSEACGSMGIGFRGINAMVRLGR